MGFNYIQVLLVFAIIAILAAAASPFYVQFQSRQQLQATATTLLSDIRLTQSRAMHRYQNDTWGIHIADSTKTYVLFYGSSYSASDSHNVPVVYPNSISLSPDQDVSLLSVTGQPSSGTAVTITVTSSRLPTESLTVTINAEGATQRL